MCSNITLETFQNHFANSMFGNLTVDRHNNKVDKFVVLEQPTNTFLPGLTPTKESSVKSRYHYTNCLLLRLCEDSPNY